MLRLLESGLPHPARGVFTTRDGGTSAAPWDSLNLAVHVGDAHAKVQANRTLLAAQLGVDGLAFGKQVHGSGVRQVRSLSNKTSRGLDDTDAMVTTASRLGLVIMGADCLPLLLTSVRGTPVVGAAHVGRGGLTAGVISAVVFAMRELGAQELAAVLGPGVCSGCYELPGSMAGEVERAAPGSRSTSRTGSVSVDLRRGASRQLEALGVRCEQVDRCTAEDPAFFSYRRDGVTGRQGGVVWLP